MKSSILYGIAAVLALLLIAGVFWIYQSSPAGQGGTTKQTAHNLQRGSNPNLDVRFDYNASQLSPGPFVDNAEFPFLLEGEGWLLQGKRIKGMASLLHKQPISALYDWLGVMQMEGLERYYDLKPAQDPLYEDWQVAERLAVHQQLVYEVSAAKPQLPGYFPAAVLESAGKGSKIHLNGWVFFTDHDLFFFQAVSGEPLSEARLAACDEVLQSMQFNALLGGTQEPTASPDPAEDSADGTGEPATEPDAADESTPPTAP